MDIQIRTRGTSSSKAGQTMGKGCGTFFFGIFLVMGLLFEGLMAKSVFRSSAAHGWMAMRCTIESSDAEISSSEDDESPYSFAVSYTYEVNGQPFTSTQLSTNGARYGDFIKVQRRIDKYPPGSSVPCWVNPQNHADAILEQTTHAFALILLFPLIFVAVGAIGIWATWFGSTASAKRAARIRDNVGETSAAATWVMAVFFAIFLAAGIGVGAFFVEDARHALEARLWPGVPCTVEASHVREHESTSDGHTSYTYAVDILYRYEMGGRSYRSSRWQFVSGSSSGRSAKQAIVDQYPVGREFTCYVNPRDPALAVIERSIGARMLLLLIPAVFTLVGAGGLVGVVRSRGRERAKAHALARDEFADRGRGVAADGAPRAGRIPAASLAAASYLPPIPGDGGAITLKPESSPLGRLFGMIFVALFWNGIVSVFLWQVVAGYQSGSMQWGLALFLVPFVLVGAALIWGVFWTLLSLANPRATVKLRSACVPLGGELELMWEMSGRTHVIERLTIHLEGVEQVTYRRGTNTCTETHTFRKIEIVNTDDRRELEQGREKVRIPANAMHSFTAPNNKITWTLVLNGSIARWPDVDEKFAVVVVPPELVGKRSES